MVIGNISNELKDTISRMAVLQSCSTDPGQTLVMTGNFINWVMGGLYSKYGYKLDELPESVRQLIQEDEQHPDNLKAYWKEAVNYYSADRQHWGLSMQICREISENILSIAIVEDMLDYAVISQSFTQEQMNLLGHHDDDEPKQKKRGYSNGNGDQ